MHGFGAFRLHFGADNAFRSLVVGLYGRVLEAVGVPPPREWF